jgi:tetratricopeptide (TPR) repeat protein
MKVLADQYSKKGDNDKATAYIQRALQLANEVFDGIKIHKKYIGIYANKSKIAVKKKNYEEAINFYRQTLDIDEKNWIGLQSIGDVYCKLKKYDQALIHYETALALLREFFQTDYNLEIARALNHIGFVYNEIKDHANAIFFLGKSLPIIRNLLTNENSPITSKTLQTISNNYRKLYYQPNSKHCFIEFNKNNNEICNGVYLFGKCKSNGQELNSDSKYYKCQECNENTCLVLCSSCLDKFEAEQYDSLNHSHPFKEHLDYYDWRCDGSSVFGRCKSNLDEIADGHKRFRCTVCDDFDLCEACLNEPKCEFSFLI